MKTSLCYVPAPTNGNQIWMERVADWENGRFRVFSPFRQPWAQNQGPRNEETADRIPIYLGSQLLQLSEGEIGVWDWSCDATGKITVSRFRADLEPIQVLSRFRDETKSSVCIADNLRTAKINCTLRAGKIAVLAGRNTGFFLPRSAFLVRAPWLALNPDVVSAAAFLSTGNVLRKEFNAANGTRVMIEFFDVPPSESGGKVLLCETSEAVRRFLKERITKKTLESASVTRAERQRFMEILGSIDLSSVPRALAENLGIPESEAAIALQDFSRKVGSIDLDEWDGETLVCAFERNEKFRKRCLSEVQNRWEKAHAEKIAAEKNETDKIVKAEQAKRDAAVAERENEVAQKNQEIAQKEERLKRLEKDIEAANSLLSETKKQADDAERAVKERLDAIRADIPKAFAEFAVLRHALGQPEPVAATGAIPRRATALPVGYEEGSVPAEGMVAKPFEDSDRVRLVSNLETAGATRAHLLSSWLCACFANHRNVLFAGPNAEAFAAAWSTALWGVSPGVLDCSKAEPMPDETAVDGDPCPVCVVRCPFEPRWIARIPPLLERLSGKKTFCVCAPFVEDLQLVPASFFAHLVPVFTAPFVAGVPSSADAFQSCAVNPPPSLNALVCSLPQDSGQIVRNPAVRERLQELLGVAAKLGGITDENWKAELVLFFALLPHSLVFGRSKALEAYLEGKNAFSDRLLDEVRSYLS